MASKWNGIDFEIFIEKEGTEQSRLVALYETALQIEAVSSREAIKEANRKNRKGRR